MKLLRSESRSRSQRSVNGGKMQNSGVRPLWYRNLVRLTHTRAAAVSIATLVLVLVRSVFWGLYSVHTGKTSWMFPMPNRVLLWTICLARMIMGEISLRD